MANLASQLDDSDVRSLYSMVAPRGDCDVLSNFGGSSLLAAAAAAAAAARASTAECCWWSWWKRLKSIVSNFVANGRSTRGWSNLCGFAGTSIV